MIRITGCLRASRKKSRLIASNVSRRFTSGSRCLRLSSSLLMPSASRRKGKAPCSAGSSVMTLPVTFSRYRVSDLNVEILLEELDDRVERHRLPVRETPRLDHQAVVSPGGDLELKD